MTSKPVPAPAAPDVLGRVLLPLRAFLGFTFCSEAAGPEFSVPLARVSFSPVMIPVYGSAARWAR